MQGCYINFFDATALVAFGDGQYFEKATVFITILLQIVDSEIRDCYNIAVLENIVFEIFTKS